MATAANPFTQHDDEMMARGMRKITLWVQDVNNREFVDRYRRQIAELTASSEAEGTELWDWMEKVQTTDGWV